jgi:hypothetical protein
MFKLLQLRVMAISAAALLLATSATAGNHTWDVVEVFSNFDGTIQFIELYDAGTIAPGNEIGIGNGSLSSDLLFHSWSNGPVAAPTLGKRYLVATQGYADLAFLQGAPAPDVILPGLVVPFFTASGDTITYSNGDSLPFLAGVPTNGTESFDEVAGVATNSPENYAGATGSIIAPAAPAAVPSASITMSVVLIALLCAVAGGSILLQRRQAAI